MPEMHKTHEFKQLNKLYKIIVFDWDGTAVKNRQENALRVSYLIKELLKVGVIIAVISGTNVNNILKQLSIDIEWQCMKNLFIFTNRRSEVYNFFENGELMLLHRRIASKKENQLLSKIADKTALEISSVSNANIKIISNRLNRRKIDLIPQWKDPQKNEIALLLKETEANLRQSGFSGGIKQAYEILTTLARSADFNDAKITSDVKYLEIGLTDKADSIKWLIENIAEKNNIKDDQILIGGDEFGTIAGFEGSDYRMILDGHSDLTYFSVGVEPEGVPERVLHIQGGPESFCKLLEKQIEINGEMN